MLDCLSTLAHGLWVCIKALLHGVEQMLMLPSWNPTLGVNSAICEVGQSLPIYPDKRTTSESGRVSQPGQKLT
jgi:hypothetical protein